jgi:predicted RNA-binding Zn-ribbon protein involved in translation (DUF1610 family)
MSMDYAHSGGLDVRLVRGLRCPKCGREMRARDVEINQPGLRVICTGCGDDMLNVEKPQ